MNHDTKTAIMLLFMASITKQRLLDAGFTFQLETVEECWKELV
jgi:hypothetical protein